MSPGADQSRFGGFEYDMRADENINPRPSPIRSRRNLLAPPTTPRPAPPNRHLSPSHSQIKTPHLQNSSHDSPNIDEVLLTPTCEVGDNFACHQYDDEPAPEDFEIDTFLTAEGEFDPMKIVAEMELEY
jgi:hypothetical protein